MRLLPYAHPPHAFFGNARFERCRFDGARLRDQTSTHEAEFVECTFRGKIRDVNFWGRVQRGNYAAALGREHNDFTGNDFTEAELMGVGFKHIDLRAQRFPGLPDYALLDRVDQRVAHVLAAIVEWPDEEVRTKARRSLTFHAERAIQDNEGYALVARAWLGHRLAPDIRDQLFSMLIDYNDNQR